MQCSFQHAKKTYGFLDWACVFLPMLVWLRRYSIKQNLVVSVCSLSSVQIELV